ncbi:unnamed protein product [Staurois parvus]|uniref:alpha-N-acetylgalactosaminide alpha-2,6-sialyltransferase n=1 Tax=Staurois parvus TaxID=386267 RepID=A0ABN9FIP8_9NEOB|nr:unnamed protein product [Staurois parvus]
MGVTWQILNETLNLMNSTGNGYMFDTWKGTSPCIRCAVVGNGGILNGSRVGKEIDSHDYVFRVNGAITAGFEKDVGNRTSFYFFGTNTMMNSFMAYGHRGFKSVPHTERKPASSSSRITTEIIYWSEPPSPTESSTAAGTKAKTQRALFWQEPDHRTLQDPAPGLHALPEEQVPLGPHPEHQQPGHLPTVHRSRHSPGCYTHL